MAHDLATAPNGQKSFAYAGQTPWHRLGQSVTEAMTATEAMTLAHLGYPVAKYPAFHQLPDGSFARIPGYSTTTRTDSNQILGVVADNYKVFQNAEAFEFLDSLVDSADLRYETAGALGVGERVWMLARMPGEIRIRSTEDVTEKYLLLATSHDASTAVRVLFTPIRVVCANTLAIALKGAKTGLSIRHVGDMAAKVRLAKETLGLASDSFRRFGEDANYLAGPRISDRRIGEYFEAIFPDETDALSAVSKKAATVRMTLRGLVDSGLGTEISEIRGTAWAAYNAVTEYVDHYDRPTLTDSRRLDAIWFGDGARLKVRAWNLAMDLAAGKDFAKTTV